jgi:DNA polymerase-3 subunit alpha
MPQFVHLHLHSQFSLLDGANRLGDVVEAAGAAGMPAMALTDHGNLFGAVEFYNRARQAGIRPIVGMEAYVTKGSRHDRRQERDGGNHRGDNSQTIEGVPDERRSERGRSNHLVLLARNEIGYRNLIRLSSRAYLEGFYYKPRIDWELLERHHEGLICLSACLKGEVAERIVAGQDKDAEALACRYRDLFGSGNYFIELQDHGIPDQRLANERLRRIAHRTGIPLVVTNDCHYLRQGDAFAHDVLLCIGTQRTLTDTDRLRYASDNFYLKSADEMFALFPDVPEALEATVGIAEACRLEIPTGSFHLPEFPVPPGYTLDSYFEEVARSGLEERLEELTARGSRSLARRGAAAYRERLEMEVRVIEGVGFSGYFLITWDFIRYARQQGIPVGPGRGSAAGSLVSYALRITDLDPLEYDLLFERFLNPDRISMPDIDIDFCMRRRGEVIQYVADKYGRDHVAQIITFGTLAAKAAIRDVGRVMGLPYAKVDRIAKLVPDMTRSLAEVAKEDPLRSEVARDPEVAKIIEVGSRLEGLTRHASVHAAGVVITPGELEELVPLYKSSKDEVMTQWDKDVIESLGLLKMDFLGLRTLTVIHDSLALLAREGRPLDLDRLPLDDPRVFRLFCEGRTEGIFQFESRGMKDLLRRAQPSKFEDLAAFNALYRPGALTSGMVEEYIQRKQGKKRVRNILPETRDILEETYGVIVYQEQVMQIAVAVAGFTMAEADVLRKAMGKKKAEVMAEQKEKFLAGAVARGHDRDKARELWDYIEPFAGYGFNKSHSVAYAMLAYQTAYLKAHHPVAFMAAMLNSELASADSIAKYVRECQDLGIEVLLPDINESDWAFTVVGEHIRFGLGAVKGVGEAAIETVIECRGRLGRFASFTHFACEADLNHKVFECLIKAGCFDGLGVHRAALMTALDPILDYAQRRRRERREGQSNLFGGASALEPAPSPASPMWSDRERLRYEKEVLGFYVTGNPLSEFREELAALASHSIDLLKEAPEEAVVVGGLVSELKRSKIKSGPNAGKFMGRFVLEDLTGRIPVMLFASQLLQFGHLLTDGAAVLVKGAARLRGTEIELSAEEIRPLEPSSGGRLVGVDLTLRADTPVRQLLALRDLLAEHPGEVPVTLRIRLPLYTPVVTPREEFKVAVDEALVASVEQLLGEGCVVQRHG